MSIRLVVLTFFCLTLFASNSIYCRGALITWGMEPFQYTAIRCLSAAAMLSFLCVAGIIRKRKGEESEGTVWSQVWQESSWPGALSLFAYMICFSLGYVCMPSADGTLIINMSVQLGMVGWGLAKGIRPGRMQTLGLCIAVTGLILLMAPGLSAPPLWNSMLMMCSGLAWAAFSVIGQKSHSAPLAMAGNFIRCIPLGLAAVLAAVAVESAPQMPAVGCALVSGALASGLGYILWYAVVPHWSLVSCSIIQLSVPLITAALAVMFLGEPITFRFLSCGALILGGVALGVVAGSKKDKA